ncbi:MAG: VanW family protein [Oscillospiraceae bacterium]|nr:VanW family protein [Oscillospiraceae bacterium]
MTKRTQYGRWLAVFLAAGLMCALLAGCGSDFNKFKNVSVAGVDLTGLTVEEAVQAVQQATKDTYTQNPMVIQILDVTREITPQQSGAALNVEAAVNAAMQWYREGGSGVFDAIPYMSLNTAVIDNTVTDLQTHFSAPGAEPGYTLLGTMPDLTPEGIATPCQTLALYTGFPEYSVSFDGLSAKILDAYNTGVFRVKLDGTMVEPKPLDLDAIYGELYLAPVDAVVNEETFEVTPEIYGYGFDLEHTKQLLSLTSYGETLQIPMERITPAALSEQIGSMFYRDVLASYSTPHTKNADRNTNLDLACQAINGHIVLPGDTFSYNEVVGERTEKKGYKGANAYENGLTVTTVGGGVCQVSSTLYYCCLVADLNIVAQREHSYAPTYMPAGTDAAVSWPSLDFKFRNNTNYPIRIEANVSGGYVNISLVGTDEKDYYIVLDPVTVLTKRYETVYEEYPADNPEGYTDGQVLVTPFTGYDVKTYRCLYSKENDQLIVREHIDTSYYSRRDRVIVKIVETVPTEPTEPTQPTDPSQPTEPGAPTEPTESPEVTEPTVPEDFTGSGGGIGADPGGAL